MRTNADTPQDARLAREMGAEGIGLCRTEHMFFKDFEHPEKSAERQLAIQEMIIAETPEARRKALDKLRAIPAARFHRNFRGHGWFAGHHPADRSAIARICSARSKRSRRSSRRRSEFRPKRWLAGSSNCTNQIRCWAIADAGWRSPIQKYLRCRCGRSSKRRSTARSGRLKCFLK